MKIQSLRGIIYLSFVALILITLIIVGLPMVNLIRNQVSETARRQTEQVLYHLEQSTERTMERIHRLSDQLTELERLRQFLIRESPGNPEAPEASEAEAFLNERFAELARIYDDVVSLFAFAHPGPRTNPEAPVRFVSSRGPFEFNEDKPLREEPWYTGALEARSSRSSRPAESPVVITPPHLQNFIKHNYIWVVSLSRRLHTAPGEQTAPPPAASPPHPPSRPRQPPPAGILLIDITIDIIKDICLKNSTDTHYYYIAAPDGTLIFHPKDQLIHSGLFSEPVHQVLRNGNRTFSLRVQGRRRIYTVRQNPLSGWKIIAVTDITNLYAPFFPALSSLAAWIILGVILLLVVSRRISTRVLTPIQYLRESIKQVEEGRFDISVPVSRYDEIGALARDFNIMVKKIGDLLALNETEHRKLRESDFKALQSQINPHFLYNTLDSVIWMTAKGRKDDVIAMVSSLAALLRRSLTGGDALIPLEEEFEHARQYSIIQKIRYRDRLICTFELPRECRHLPVPRLILQPLIENALHHGIENRDESGRITITAERIRDTLRITVSDNGAGADIHHLRALLIGGETDTPRTGIGLRNISDRLKILFGENSNIDFRPRQPGLDVILTIRPGARKHRSPELPPLPL